MKTTRETLAELRREERKTEALARMSLSYDHSIEQMKLVDRWAAAAQRNGATFAEIGALLGISRQAARKRYGK